jgi:RNA polymerase sigma-70 factor (ECF subfamily)
MRHRGWFLTTCWPAVKLAGGTGPVRDAALNDIIVQYHPALKEYVRSRFGVDPHTAEDLVQGFFLDKVVRRNLIGGADRGKGKFRTLLLTSINRYAVDVFRREEARKRIPKSKLRSLEEVSEWAEDGLAAPPGGDEFDNAFVRQVLALAIHRLHAHCARKNQACVWSVFYHRVLLPTLEEAQPKSYESLAADLKLHSGGEARNRLVTAKRILQKELRLIVEEYSSDSAEVSNELAELRRLLA